MRLPRHGAGRSRRAGNRRDRHRALAMTGTFAANPGPMSGQMGRQGPTSSWSFGRRYPSPARPRQCRWRRVRAHAVPGPRPDARSQGRRHRRARVPAGRIGSPGHIPARPDSRDRGHGLGIRGHPFAECQSRRRQSSSPRARRHDSCRPFRTRLPSPRATPPAAFGTRARFARSTTASPRTAPSSSSWSCSTARRSRPSGSGAAGDSIRARWL